MTPDCVGGLIMLILLYFGIGTIISAWLSESPQATVACGLLWPIVLLIYAVAGICGLIKALWKGRKI